MQNPYFEPVNSSVSFPELEERVMTVIQENIYFSSH